MLWIIKNVSQKNYCKLVEEINPDSVGFSPMYLLGPSFKSEVSHLMNLKFMVENSDCSVHLTFRLFMVPDMPCSSPLRFLQENNVRASLPLQFTEQEYDKEDTR